MTVILMCELMSVGVCGDYDIELEGTRGVHMNKFNVGKPRAEKPETDVFVKVACTRVPQSSGGGASGHTNTEVYGGSHARTSYTSVFSSASTRSR